MPDDSPATKDKISFEEGEKKITPPIQDIEEKEMRDKAIKGLEQQQVNEQTKIEAGIVTPPQPAESVPKEVPYLLFHYGAKAISCPAFQTDDEENKIISRHLSILIGAQNSKVWSLIVILLIIFGKLVQCWGAVTRFIKREKKEDNNMKVTETLGA